MDTTRMHHQAELIEKRWDVYLYTHTQNPQNKKSYKSSEKLEPKHKKRIKQAEQGHNCLELSITDELKQLGNKKQLELVKSN